MSLMFGDNVERATQHLIGMAFAHRTPEAMQEAVSRLEGIRTLLIFTDTNNTHELFALGNEIQRCRRAIDLLKAGKL
jgi:hypothetical protein